MSAPRLSPSTVLVLQHLLALKPDQLETATPRSAAEAVGVTDRTGRRAFRQLRNAGILTTLWVDEAAAIEALEGSAA